MNHKQYQEAFDWLSPSPEAVEKTVSQADRPVRRTSVLVRVAVAAAAVLVLTGSAFAAVHFHWFSVGGAEHIVQPTHNAEAFGQDENLPPAPQNLLTLEGAPSDTYIGFTLPESYRNGQDSLNCRMLKDGLYQRYYRNPDPSDPASPLLTIEIVYDANWLIRSASEVVKEEVLNGMQTVWLRMDGASDDRPLYCLFQRNETLGCFAVIASTTSFDEAEQAASELRFEDSGTPISQEDNTLYYGFRLGWEPSDLDVDSQTVMADRWYLANATLCDERLDLSEILLSKGWFCRGDVSCSIGVSLVSGLSDITPVDAGTEFRSGTINGHPAHWVKGCGGGTYIQVKFIEQQVQLYACVSCYSLNPETGNWEPLSEEDARFVAIAEQLLESAELIPVEIAEPAPADFQPFAVG